MQVVLETSLIPHTARIWQICVSCTVVMWMVQNRRMASVGRHLWSKDGGPAEPSPEQQPQVPQPARVHRLLQPPSSFWCLLDCIRVSSCCCLAKTGRAGSAEVSGTLNKGECHFLGSDGTGECCKANVVT